MLSKSQKLTEMERLKKLPVLDPPKIVRLKFRKVGSLQYTSHLDLQRTFNRVIVRACIPVWYSKGFNPHIKLVFSTPLSVGTQSETEFLDIRLDRDMSCEEIMERLNRELTEELCILDAYIPNSDFSEIGYAEYNMEICTSGASEAMAASIENALTKSPMTLTKKTKSGEKEIDIVPLIYSVKAIYSEDSSTIKLNTVLSASVGDFLNPEMLITGLKQALGILSGDPTEEWYDIVRVAIYKSNMTNFK